MRARQTMKKIFEKPTQAPSKILLLNSHALLLFNSIKNIITAHWETCE